MPTQRNQCPACGQLKNVKSDRCRACRIKLRKERAALTVKGHHNTGSGAWREKERIDAVVRSAWQKGSEYERLVIEARNPAMKFD